MEWPEVFTPKKHRLYRVEYKGEVRFVCAGSANRAWRALFDVDLPRVTVVNLDGELPTEDAETEYELDAASKGCPLCEFPECGGTVESYRRDKFNQTAEELFRWLVIGEFNEEGDEYGFAFGSNISDFWERGADEDLCLGLARGKKADILAAALANGFVGSNDDLCWPSEEALKKTIDNLERVAVWAVAELEKRGA